MSFYNRIKNYYEKGLWTAEMTANAVVKNKITPEEYKEITGNEYKVI